MKYHNIIHDDMLNGDGLRTTLFVAGCNHECKECQNPETWDVHGGIPFDADAREEIFIELQHDYISGLTISGGDPLHPLNRADVTALCKEVKAKFPEKTIWVYTGYLYEEVENLEVLQYIDVLVDGPFINKKKSPKKPWVGSSNQRVIFLKDGKFDHVLEDSIDSDVEIQTVQKTNTSCTI